MKEKLKFIKDVANNLIAFGIYIFSMQVLFLPFMSRNLSPEANAKLLAFIVIMNFSSTALGSQLGILYQLVMPKNTKPYTKNDFRFLSLSTSVVLFIGAFIGLTVMNYSWIEIIVLSLVTLLANNRLFYQGILRSEKKFNQVGISNFIYFIGMIIGVIICRNFSMIFWLPILLADFFSNSSLLYMKRDMLYARPYKTEDFKNITHRYGELSFSAFLLNIPGYFDKLLTLPLLGASTMGVYYAGTALSRVFFLAVNPINGVLLPWLSSLSIDNMDELIKKYIRINIGVLFITFLLGIPFNYISARILYPHLLNKIMTIVAPVSLIAAFQVAASLLYTVYLNFFKIKNIKYINIINIFTFLTFGFLGAKVGGLKGYAYGIAVSKLFYWGSYVYLLKNSEYKITASNN